MFTSIIIDEAMAKFIKNTFAEHFCYITLNDIYFPFENFL